MTSDKCVQKWGIDMNTDVIRKLAKENQAYALKMRREFHQNPEISGQEQQTRKRLIRELEQMGVLYRLLPGTGLIAFVQGEKPGRGRVIRADIDGLAVQESEKNLKQQKTCCSTVPGTAHACGHDAHMAMLLGTIRVLMALRSELAGTVYCCFEEGEETNCGVFKMLDALKEYDIEKCFALHVYNGLEAGKIDITPGPRMAGDIIVGIQVHGVSGHGSRPDQAINPIIPAAHIITELDSAFRNQLDAEKPLTLGICIIQAGAAPNIIPDKAYMRGTIRYFDTEEGQKAMEIVRRVSENTADSHRCTIAFEPELKLRLLPVVNDPAVAVQVSRDVAKIWGEEALGSCGKWYASECFSRYMNCWPGALGFLGIRNEELGSGAPHHNGAFDIDESVLSLGICAEAAFAFGEAAQ